MPRTLKYKRTKEGMIKDMYDSQRSNSKARGMHQPTYSVQELIDWAFSQRCFHEIYDNWKAGSYESILRPSFDRLDNLKSYTLDNLRIVTWGENAQQAHEDQKSGKDMRMNKACAEIDSDGNILHVWHSTRHADRELGFCNGGVSSVCLGKRNRIFKRMFKFITDEQAKELMK